MKIKSLLGALQQDAAKVSNQSQSNREAAKAGNERRAEKSQSDSVNVSMAKMIAGELDPTKLAAERREKIERLKQLIASGEYNPPADLVAQAISEEIDFEITTTPAPKDI